MKNEFNFLTTRVINHAFGTYSWRVIGIFAGELFIRRGFSFGKEVDLDQQIDLITKQMQKRYPFLIK